MSEAGTTVRPMPASMASAPPAKIARGAAHGYTKSKLALAFRCAIRQHNTPVFPTADFNSIRCACDLPVIAT